MRSRHLVAALALALAAGCGGSSKKPDNGSPSTQYPAPHAALPQMVNNGGGVEASPVLYSVTWPGDPLAAQLDDFTAKIGASTYWAATTAEYGVGPAVLGSAIHMATTLPATIDDNYIDTMLQTMLDGTHPEWGTPTANSQYVLYFPDTTVIQSGGTSCQAFLAYHYSVVVAGGVEVAYSVIPRCGAFGGLSVLEVATESASHELVEAATDPLSNAAWIDTDASGGAWNYMTGGGETGDMCQDIANIDVTPADLGYLVQRAWSNASAAAGHDPCVPASGAYFNAAPVLPDTAQIDLGGGFLLATAAVKIPVGGTRTLELDLFSDAATSGPFAVHASDAAEMFGFAPELSFHLDRNSGVNGEKIHLKVQVLKSGAFYSGGHFFYVVADLGNAEHYWPVFVSN